MTYLAEQFLQEFECAYIEKGCLKHPVSSWVYRHCIAVLRSAINDQCLCASIRSIPCIDERHDFPHAALMLDFIQQMRKNLDICDIC